MVFNLGYGHILDSSVLEPDISLANKDFAKLKLNLALALIGMFSQSTRTLQVTENNNISVVAYRIHYISLSKLGGILNKCT